MELSGNAILHLPVTNIPPQRADGGGPDLVALARHLEFDVQAMIPEGLFSEPLQIAGRGLKVDATSVQVSVLPGEPLLLSSQVRINDEPLQLRLRAQNMAGLLQRPSGPWRNLSLEGASAGLSFSLQGDIERPLEARGASLEFQMAGSEISNLLPLINLILPLQGAYTLSGRFSDTAQGADFDDLKIYFGRSDISGRLQVAQGKERPRLVLELFSDELYLMDFLPEQAAILAATANERVIPDFALPVERMREVDGELRFTGKQLRTAAGDLGDVSFKVQLQDQLFSLREFRVRDWAGALIEATGSIDASQTQPPVELQLSVRDLNYGILLRQAGLAETVEGTLNITLSLHGEGSSRYEILDSANGELIILGKEGRFGSRRLDLWGSDLVTTMLSPSWRREDTTSTARN
jgi:uncharacterized protein involved in outer membrane biogenesis